MRLPAPSAIKGISGAAGRWSLLIRASELGQPDVYDTSVSLDLARQQELFTVLQLLKDTRGERQLLFPFSHIQATKEMENALKQLRCQQLQNHAISLRHGGASEDRDVNARSLEELDGRGSTVCDATKTCSLVAGYVQDSTRTSLARHSNATWNDSGKGFCAHRTHF